MQPLDRVMHETVRCVPATPPCCVLPEETLADVLALLKKNSHSGVLVCSGEVLIGIFTERDALRAMTRRVDIDQPIGRLMTPHPTTLTIESTIGDALQKMAIGGFRRLPIVDSDNHPLAVIDMPALVHYVDEYFPGAVYNLPPKIMLCTPERAGA